MRFYKQTIIAIQCVLAMIVFTAGTPPVAKSTLQIDIKHVVGQALLELDSVEYKNQLGQTFTISRFRYYISNVRLKKADGAEVSLPGYFLVDEAEPDSKSIKLAGAPVGNYSSISFIIGVDSLHNCTGAQSGALDPVNGMFWTWNTGYIFLKLEGHANVSNSPGHIFEYHIGGYAAPNNSIRQVTLNFAAKGFTVAEHNNNRIALNADVLQILKNPVTIDFSKLSSVTDFHNAATIANNYSKMFTINTGE